MIKPFSAASRSAVAGLCMALACNPKAADPRSGGDASSVATAEAGMGSKRALDAGVRVSSGSDAGTSLPRPDPQPAVPTDAPLCAACLSPLGGETGDFVPGPSGGPAPAICDVEIRDLEAAADAGSEVEAFVAEVERSFEVAAVWVELPDADVRPASGFSASTDVELRVQVVKAQAVEREPTDPEYAEYCSDYVQLVAQVEFATADTAVRGSFEGTVTRHAAGVWAFSAWQPANHFTGTLDLGARADEDESVAAGLRLYAYDDTVRGLLSPLLVTPATNAAPDRGAYELISAIELRFPDDGCAPDERPARANEAALLSDRLRESIEGSNPLPAHHWRGLVEPARQQDAGAVASAGIDTDRPTEVSLVLSDVDAACHVLTTAGARTEASFGIPVALSMSDEWVTLNANAQGSASTDEDGEFVVVSLGAEGDPIPVAEFVDRYGIRDLDLPEGDCAQLNLFGKYERAGGELTSYGHIEVVGGPCDWNSDYPYFGNRSLAFVSWCDGCGIDPWPSFVDRE